MSDYRSTNKDYHDRPKVEWEVQRETVEDNITIRLKILPLGRPKFSIEIGINEGDDFRPRIPIMPDGVLTEAHVAGIVNIGKRIEELVVEAKEIIEESDRAYKERQAARAAREQSLKKEGSPPAPTNFRNSSK